MSVEDAHGSTKRPMVGGRRVSLVLAAPIVLLCGCLGVALGSIFPPHVWMPRGGEVHKASDDPAAVIVAAASAPTDAEVPGEISEMALLETLPAPATEDANADTGEPTTQLATAPAPRKGEKTNSTSKKAKQQFDRENRRRVASHSDRKRPERERKEPETRERSRPLISQIPVVGPVFGLFMQ